MRAVCPACQYPQNTCVCQWVEVLKSPVRIVVLQHYREITHAKNTVKLAKLALPNLEVITVKNEQDIVRFAKSIDISECAIFYPHTDSVPMESHLSDFKDSITTLVFLDGSWKQAGGMANCLAALPTKLPATQFFHYQQLPASQYRIRHTKQASALSTLEAISYTLNTAYNTDTSAMLALLKGFQSHWRGPEAHRRG